MRTKHFAICTYQTCEIKQHEMGGTRCMRAQEEQYTLVGTHELKKLVGGHRRRWGNNIKMDLNN